MTNTFTHIYKKKDPYFSILSIQKQILVMIFDDDEYDTNSQKKKLTIMHFKLMYEVF